MLFGRFPLTYFSREIVVIGAGPAGLAAAVEFTRAHLPCVILEKGCIANSIYHFPDLMTFFSDPRSLEIGGVEMRVAEERPTRLEALEYYRHVARSSGVEIRQREEVFEIDGADGDFRIHSSAGTRRARKVVLATGYYSQPNLMEIPGEFLPKVTHYYRDAHPYFDREVAVIGGRNSAGIAALELAAAGARVTLIHRRDRFSMKPWISRRIDEKIRQGAILALLQTTVEEITPESIRLQTPHGFVEQRNDFVFALTGYHADFDFLRRNAIPLADCGTRPLLNPETLETGRPGIYLAGTVMTGKHTHEMAIDQSRHHGARIAEHLRRARSAAA